MVWRWVLKVPSSGPPVGAALTRSLRASGLGRAIASEPSASSSSSSRGFSSARASRGPRKRLSRTVGSHHSNYESESFRKLMSGERRATATSTFSRGVVRGGRVVRGEGRGGEVRWRGRGRDAGLSLSVPSFLLFFFSFINVLLSRCLCPLTSFFCLRSLIAGEAAAAGRDEGAGNRERSSQDGRRGLRSRR